MGPNFKELTKSVVDLLDKKEYTAAIEKLIEELSYINYFIDGDHGMNVISVKDLLKVCEVIKQ